MYVYVYIYLAMNMSYDKGLIAKRCTAYGVVAWFSYELEYLWPFFNKAKSENPGLGDQPLLIRTEYLPNVFKGA